MVCPSVIVPVVVVLFPPYSLFNIVAAVLHLGNLEFEAVTMASEDGSRIANREVLGHVAELLACPGIIIERALTRRLIKVGGGTYVLSRILVGETVVKRLISIDGSSDTRPACSVSRKGRSVAEKLLEPPKAIDARNALAKALYDSLFEWLVGRINTTFAPSGKVASLVGVLDLFGFEIFENNR